jgi:t-SNARE complex subunit (syntaxin)
MQRLTSQEDSKSCTPSAPNKQKPKHKKQKSKDIESGLLRRDDRQTVLSDYAKSQQQIFGLLHDLDNCISTLRQIHRKLKNRQNIVQLSEKSQTYEKNPLHRYFHRMGIDWTTRFLDQCTQEREHLKQRNIYLEDKTRGPITEVDSFHPMVSLQPTEEEMSERIMAKTEIAFAKSPEMSLEDKQLTQVKAGNEVINEQLDGISYKLSHLKAIATDMNVEVKAQNEIIPEIQDKTVGIQAHVETATNRVNRALRSLSQSHYSRYFVLCLIITGLVVYLLKLILG